MCNTDLRLRGTSNLVWPDKLPGYARVSFAQITCANRLDRHLVSCAVDSPMRPLLHILRRGFYSGSFFSAFNPCNMKREVCVDNDDWVRHDTPLTWLIHRSRPMLSAPHLAPLHRHNRAPAIPQTTLFPAAGTKWLVRYVSEH